MSDVFKHEIDRIYCSIAGDLPQFDTNLEDTVDIVYGGFAMHTNLTAEQVDEWHNLSFDVKIQLCNEALEKYF